MVFILKPQFGDLSVVKTTCVYCFQNVMFFNISISQTYSAYTFTALQQIFLQELSLYAPRNTFKAYCSIRQFRYCWASLLYLYYAYIAILFMLTACRGLLYIILTCRTLPHIWYLPIYQIVL